MSFIKENPSILSKDLKLENGNLKSSGSLEIEGIIIGDIEAYSVSIRETGNIRGNIKSKILNIKGTLIGSAFCEKINISETAKIDGDLNYSVLAVDYGAKINCQLKRIENSKDIFKERPSIIENPKEPIVNKK